MTTPSTQPNVIHLITNAANIEPSLVIQASISPTVIRTRNYISTVLTGDGKRPHCPFVETIETKNGYYILPYEQPPEGINFPEIIEQLNDKFRTLSPTKTTQNQPVDVTTVIGAFGHEDAMNESFCKNLEAQRNEHRLEFLQQGLMLAHMHPFHSVGSNSSRRETKGEDPLYVSKIPLLMVRRMHQPDHVFMKTSEEKAVYAKYFGPMPFRCFK